MQYTAEESEQRKLLESEHEPKQRLLPELDNEKPAEKCENGMVYTVEGNSGDAVRQRSYAVGYDSIMGYGVVAY